MKLILITLVAVVVGMMVACSSNEPMPDIEATVKAIVERESKIEDNYKFIPVSTFPTSPERNPFKLFQGERDFRFAKMHEGAIADYTKVIQLDPDDAGAYASRGYSYFELGEYQSAVEDSDKAIQLDPEESLHYHNRGFAYYRLGQYQLAIEDFTKAIEILPEVNKPAYYYFRAYAYDALGESQAAIADYNKACSHPAIQGWGNIRCVGGE